MNFKYQKINLYDTYIRLEDKGNFVHAYNVGVRYSLFSSCTKFPLSPNRI